MERLVKIMLFQGWGKHRGTGGMCPPLSSVPPSLKKIIPTLYSFYIVGPEWLKNLYFAYLLVLRAIVKVEPYWKHYQFYTGNKVEDQITRAHVATLIRGAK